MKSGALNLLRMCMVLAAFIFAGGLFAQESNAADCREIAVAVNATVTFEPEDINFRGMTFDNNTVADDSLGVISYVLYESSTGKRKAQITGIQAGTVAMTITYLDGSGKEKTQAMHIHVTDPTVGPFEEVFVVGRTYFPTVTGIAGCSSMHIASQDSAIVKTDYDDRSVPTFIPCGLGAVKIAVVVDGRTYVQPVISINPMLSTDYLIIEKKETSGLTVDGIPPTMQVTYRSSNRKVATVSEDGVITGKKNGECVVTASVHVSEDEVIKLKCNVTIGTRKSVLAVRAAEAVLGAKYSQERRMQKGYYDCSSLIWRSYREAGYPLGSEDYAPVAADIAKKLEKEWTVVSRKYVEPALLEPGDLIFYKSSSNNDRYKSIGHVAMYYGSYYPDGEEGANRGRIIHANHGVELTEYSSFRKSKIVLILRSGK